LVTSGVARSSRPTSRTRASVCSTLAFSGRSTKMLKVLMSSLGRKVIISPSMDFSPTGPDGRRYCQAGISALSATRPAMAIYSPRRASGRSSSTHNTLS